jgi:co-chaperonin GroES (HSP10)
MLQPLGKRIIIEPLIKGKKSPLLTLKEDPAQSYKVISIGDEIKKVNISDIILVDLYAVSELLYNDIKYYLIHEDNIHAIVKAS